jgi:hypothetical protein
MTGQTSHDELKAYVRKLTADEALHVVADAQEAMKANPEGAKSGYYADLSHYCAMRIYGSL